MSTFQDELFSEEGLKALFHHSNDVIVKSVRHQHLPDEWVHLVFCGPLVDLSQVQSLILPFVSNMNPVEDLLFNYVHTESFDKETLNKEDIILNVFNGKLLAVTSASKVYFFDIADMPKRQPDESVVEVSVSGPRDGLVEDLSTNIGLIRRRLRTASLVIENYTIGKRSKTNISLLYIYDIINDDILQQVKEKIEAINIDILTGRMMLSELICSKKNTLVPLTGYTGRPDFIIQALNQGRFAIIIDGSPTALIAPINLGFLLKTAEDTNTNYYFASLERLLRFVGLFISIFLPGFYTALTTHNVGQLPLPLIATITLARMGLPFSSLIEMLIMLIMFELFKEAGARLPKGIGQTVAVLGGLIIGDAAIRGGITSPTLLVVIGITAISSFTLVNQSLSGNIFFIRLYVLFMSYFLGIYGFLIAMISILIYLTRLQSFGLPYLSIGAAEQLTDVIKTFIKVPTSFQKKRNEALQIKDDTRTGDEN